MAFYSNLLNDLDDIKNETNTEFNSNNYSFDIKSFIRVIDDNYKQILLLLLVFVIIYVVDHITYYNALFYGMVTSVLPQQQQSQSQQPQQIKSNTFKKKARKLKK